MSSLLACLTDLSLTGSLGSRQVETLTPNFLVAVVNMLNSSKEISEFSFENAAVKSICYCKQRMKSRLSLFFFFRMC